MRATPSPASRRAASVRKSALVCLAVMVALGAVACEDRQAPTAPPATEPQSLKSLEPDGLTFDPAAVAVSNTWATRSPIPRAFEGARAGTLNGIIYVVGGSDVVGRTRAVQAHDVATNTWSARRPLPSARNVINGASPVNGRLYVTGGLNSSSAPTKTFYVYNPGTNTWVARANLPVAGGCGAQAVIEGQFYVYSSCSPNNRHFLWRYNPVTNTWVTRKAPPTIHRHPAAGVIGGKFYLAGGFTPTGGDNLTLDVYNPATNSWVTRAPLPAPLAGPASGVLKGKLHVAGGEESGFRIATLRVYNPTTNAWTTKASMPTGRTGPAGAIANGRLFVIAGLGNGIRNEVEAYTP